MLNAVDWTIVGAYVAVVAALGFWTGRKQRTTEDYMLGGRRIPWWAAGLSIIATETSALTFLGAPTQSLSQGGDWRYLQTTMGSIVARFFVAGLLIGLYYRARVFTVYDWLGERFGARTRDIGTTLFFIGRSLGSGVRLYGAAIALWVITDRALSFPAGILLIALAAVAYTLVGGIRAVIWTDVLQGLLLLAAGSAALVYLLYDSGLTPMEAWQRLSSVEPAAKNRIFDFSLDPQRAYTIWSGLIGLSLLTMATHGTDQDMVQRMLTCKDARAGRRSLFLSAAITLPMVILFLSIGSLLWLRLDGDAGAAALAAKLASQAGESNAKKGFDYIFCWVAVHEFPVGLRGLIVAGVFAAAMSSLDSAISALASTAVRNVWMTRVAPGRDDAYYLRVSRRLTLGFGLLLSAIAFVVWASHSSGSAAEGFGVLMLGLKVLTWIFPPILGVVLAGALTSRGSDGSAFLGVLCGVAVLLLVEFGYLPFGLSWAWSWNPLVGVAVAFVVAVSLPRAAATP